MSTEGIEQYSLEQLRDLGSLNPRLSKFSKRVLVKTYEEFIEILYDDIDDIVTQGYFILDSR